MLSSSHSRWYSEDYRGKGPLPVVPIAHLLPAVSLHSAMLCFLTICKEYVQ